MKIYEDKCVGCGRCVPYCPMGAIKLIDRYATINQDECVECGVCLRMEVCPVDAIYEPKEVMEWPRSVRKAFSDATCKHENTGVRGRGTEEVKTNDVTARFKRGFVGVALEFGRPGTGTMLKDVEVITEVLAREGVEFEPKNPLTFLMEDVHTGKIRDDVRNEKVLSAIVEFVISEDKLEDTIIQIRESADKTNSIFSWGFVARFDENGELPIIQKLEEMGYKVPRHMKINVGLGKPKREE